ncbi:MAG: HgcAB-like fusion protein [Promethearchaeota archaeon]
MTIKSAFKLFGAYFFRWFSFSIEPTLKKIGNPNQHSPVFITCNFNLTVKRVLKSIKDLDCYLLIAPSNGINVWCGACGGDFMTDSVISIIKTSKINELVSHRTLILPQLSAPGIDPVVIKEKVGWNARFGPVYAKDIQNYVKNNLIKTEKQRNVHFPVSRRLEMANLYFFSLLLLISTFYWIFSIFISYLDLYLYLDSIFILILTIFGSLLILPSIKTETGRIKVWIYEIFILTLIIIISLFLVRNLLYLIWNIILSILFTFVMAEDFHGLTPIYKSELGEKTWNKGKTKMKVIFGEYRLQPYGEINIEGEKCVGCKMCIEVCPREVYYFDDKKGKAVLKSPSKCINCHACVNRCLAQCLNIV